MAEEWFKQDDASAIMMTSTGGRTLPPAIGGGRNMVAKISNPILGAIARGDDIAALEAAIAGRGIHVVTDPADFIVGGTCLKRMNEGGTLGCFYLVQDDVQQKLGGIAPNKSLQRSRFSTAPVQLTTQLLPAN